MADLYSPQTAGVYDGTLPPLSQSPEQKGKVRSIVAKLNLASVPAITNADNVLLGVLPPGAVPLYGIIHASATMGAAAQLAIGTNKVHASNGQYRASAIFTAVETPTMFGITTAMGTPVTAETPVYLTTGTAAIPTAGTLIIELFYANQG